MSELEQIKNQLDEVEAFFKKLESQQLDYPLDSLSKKVIFENVLIDAMQSVEPYSLATYNESTSITVNDVKYLLDTTQIYTQY